jgi:hypothetical protein
VKRRELQFLQVRTNCRSFGFSFASLRVRDDNSRLVQNILGTRRLVSPAVYAGILLPVHAAERQIPLKWGKVKVGKL